MDELVDFLRAQLDDDERVAQAATGGVWRWRDPGTRIKMALMADEQMVVPSATPDVYPSVYDADHIARHDPARVLAEVDAKRRILDMVKRWMDAGYPTMDSALFLLALPYADRPGYRADWRP